MTVVALLIACTASAAAAYCLWRDLTRAAQVAALTQTVEGQERRLAALDRRLTEHTEATATALAGYAAQLAETEQAIAVLSGQPADVIPISTGRRRKTP